MGSMQIQNGLRLKCWVHLNFKQGNKYLILSKPREIYSLSDFTTKPENIISTLSQIQMIKRFLHADERKENSEAGKFV